jgi:hypothetical protein
MSLGFCLVPMQVVSTVRGDVYVLPPEVMRDVGNGILKKGERVLNLFVQKVAQEFGAGH